MTNRLLPSRLLTLTIVLALSLVSCISGHGNVSAADSVRVGVYENKPLIFMDERGVPSGLFADLLMSIAEREGWSLEFIPGHWDDLFAATVSGEIDMLPVVAFTRSREEILDFNDETVMANWAEVYSSPSFTLTSILDLEGKRVAVKMGDIHFKALKELTDKFNVSCRFIETDGYTTVFEMLDAGYLDIGIVNRMFGRANMSKHNIKISPIIFNPIEVRFAAPKGKHTDLLTTLDTHLSKAKRNSDSAYHKALDKWLTVDTQMRIPPYVRYLIGAILATVVFLFSISLLLRHQVSKQTNSLRQTNIELQKEMEKHRQTTKTLQKYARVVEASLDAIALFDSSGGHLLVNKAYLRLFARTRPELENATLRDIVGEDFFENHFRTKIRSCLEGKRTHATVVFHPEGKEMQHWHVQFAPYTSQYGSVEGYSIDIHDITQMKQLENKLKQAQKMETIGLMAGGVAHDLNNILSGLVSYPDMLLVDRPESDPMHAPLQTIKKSGIRAAAIVSDLLTLARHGVDNKTTVNLNDIVSEITASPEFTMLLEEHPDIMFRPKPDGDLLNMEGSAVHLAKCLLNLITNAVESMADEGTISLSTQNRYIETAPPLVGMELGEYVTIAVSDTGSGITSDQLHYIFEPFYTSKVMGRSGTGLGMTLVWNTVKDHEGYIDVDTEPGKGTTFTLYFPVSRKKIEKKQIENMENYRGDGRSVLVVDDIPEQRALATEILEKLEYQVATAESGEAALAQVSTRSFDLIVLDMIMPGGMGGLEAFEEVLRINPSQKAIIASGYSDTEDIRKAQKLGAGRYVRKPYTVHSLAKAVKEELRQ